LTGLQGLAKGWGFVSCQQTSVGRADPSYPQRLARLRDAPEFLHIVGSLPEKRRVIAAVGARAASGHGTASAREICGGFAACGGLVLSGGAVGVDAAAHRGALDGGGVTAVVLGSGLDHLYPQTNRPLFDRVVEAGGALVSPFAADLTPRPGTFVRRNRVMAGMADAVVVFEASAGSGSLHTARAALELGRLVAAMPGSPGTEALIAQGAAVVRDLDDLLAALDGAPRRPEVDLPAGGTDEAVVLSALADDPVGEEALVVSTGLTAPAISRALTGLELEGLAILLPGRTYVRSTLARELMVR
jgi:DNA processing protein